MDPIAPVEPLTERVARTLREAIVDGKLTPGERLSVPELARRLGVSRTPAREALLLLEREGLVANRPRLGAEVLRASDTGFGELVDIREALDGMVARLAAERMTDSEHEELQALLKAHDKVLRNSDLDNHIAFDLEFHGLLRDGARNGRLAKALLDIERQIQLHMRVVGNAPGLAKAVMHDHGAIVDAIVARNPDAAEKAARAHVHRMRKFSASLAKPAATAAAAA